MERNSRKEGCGGRVGLGVGMGVGGGWGERREGEVWWGRMGAGDCWESAEGSVECIFQGLLERGGCETQGSWVLVVRSLPFRATRKSPPSPQLPKPIATAQKLPSSPAIPSTSSPP